MASGKHSTRSQRKYNSIRIALAAAVLEWLLICMLFGDAILSYLITKFASYCQLQTPCLLCSRLDHILGNRKLKYYWGLICTTHKLEISSLVLCHAHNNLVDVHGICESCLFSFAPINGSNSETYRLLVGKLGDDSSVGLNETPVLNDHESSSRRCSCCNEPWVPRGYSQKLLQTKTVDFETNDSDVLLPGDIGNYKDNLQKIERSVSVRDTRINKGFDHLSHVGYTEINVNSDTESDAVFSDDDKQINFKEDLAVGHPQTEAHKTFLPNDLAKEKITDGVTSPQSPTSVSQVKSDSVELHGVSSVLPTAAMEKGSGALHWQQADDDVNLDPSALLELISLGEIPSSSIAKDMPVETSTENKFNSTDDVPPSSDVEKILVEESKWRVLISLENVPSSDAGATPVEASEKSELISVDDTLPSTESKETTEQISIDDKHVSLVNVFPSPITKDIPVEAAKEKKLDSLDNVPPSLDVEGTLFKESKRSTLISTKNVPSPTDASGSPVEATEKSELISLHDTLPSSESTENLTQISTEDRLDALAHIVPRSSAVETPVQGLKEKCVARSEETWQAVVTDNEDMTRTESPTVAVKTSERIPLGDSALQVPNLLDLSEAYKLAVGSKGRQLSGVLAEQWTGKEKDSSKVSDDLKLIFSQLSAAREQMTNDGSPRVTISPRVSMSPRFSVNSEEMKNLGASSNIGMQLLQKRISLERNESGLSLDGSTVSEIEGETAFDRLSRQVEHDRKLLSALYKELEEERNASAIAASQAMAMITRLQEEKATLQMEALQCLRMMEEQAEYDTEALQKTNDLLAEREKEIQELEMELEFYRNNCTSESILAEDTKKQNEELSEATTVEVS